MGTRSRIGVMHGDICKSVYCHWDGYLEGVGATLLEHYDSVHANYLVALGDISSLGDTIGEEHPFSQFDVKISSEEYDKLYGNMTTFYGRDRGEKNVDYRVAQTFAEFKEQFENCGGEYYYIMKDGTWYCGGYGIADLTPLAEALAKETA
jgi:hypothetical protein